MTAKTDDSGDAKPEFHLKEWESLRQEILQQVDHTRSLEFGSVASLGAFYAWFASSDPQPSRFLLAIPTLLAVLAGVRAAGTVIRIQEIASYIIKIEERFSLDKTEGLIGWERARSRAESLAKPRPESSEKPFVRALKNLKASPFKYSAVVFWVVTLAVSVLAWFFCSHFGYR